jgi:polysaccharide deacetylase family protein (PEP-CTERM system associated)
VKAREFSSAAIVNALTIDVEDYFQVSAFAQHIPRSDWGNLPCRVERNIDCVLALLADARVHATFFTLGWIAERYPALVTRIRDGGHEIASHGFAHERANEQDAETFLADIRLAKAILEDVSGQEVQGYRAPSFSIGPGNPWAFDCIAAAGYRYSSSIYPIQHDHYGVPDAPRFPHRVREGLMEVPIATVRVIGRNWPAGGGGYFRLLPYAVSRWSIRRINVNDGMPAIFYFHPWELDPEQPRVAGASAKARFRHYVNLDRVQIRLRQLLNDFAWDRMNRVFMNEAA